MQFLVKNMFLACFKANADFSLSIRIDDSFLIIISADSTTYIIVVGFQSQNEIL